MLSNSVRNIGYSSNVVATLRVGDARYPLASVGPKFFILRDGQDLPIDSRCVLEVVVDGKPFEWNIILTNGAVPFENRVEFTI